jgi:predicted nucleic acid-binding protein
VTDAGPRGPVVIDTAVFGAGLIRPSPLAELYRPILRGRPSIISFQTAAELRYGARRKGWGQRKMAELEERIDRAETVWSGPELLDEYVDLRVRCERIGHALCQREHDADRWIAATATWLGISLVAHDGIFRNVPGLVLETALHS